MSLEIIRKKTNKLFEANTSAFQLNNYANMNTDAVVEKMGLNERDFEILYTTPNAFEEMMVMVKGSSFNPWNVRFIFLNLLEKYMHHGEQVLNSKASPFFLKEYVVRNGYYQNISSIDKLLLEKEKNTRALGAAICDIEKCKYLIKDKEVSVRKIAFSRLGPVNHLDDMLKDKHATIRTMGVRFAPYSYPLLDDLVDDNSQMVVDLLIDKIRYEKVPFLLANRSLLRQREYVKSHFKTKIEKRLERGV